MINAAISPRFRRTPIAFSAHVGTSATNTCTIGRKLSITVAIYRLILEDCINGDRNRIAIWISYTENIHGHKILVWCPYAVYYTHLCRRRRRTPPQVYSLQRERRKSRTSG